MSRNGSGTYSRVAGTPYVNGSTIDETVVNNEMSDIATALTESIARDGQTVPTANLPMGTYKHTNVAVGSALTDYARLDQVQNSGSQWLTSVSGADTITATATPTPAAYATGQTFRFVSAGANTGAATLNISGLGAKAVTKDGSTALVAGDIKSGAVVEVSYDGTRFQLVSDAGAGLRTSDIGTTVQAYDADIPTVAASQAEMEAGTEAALRSVSPLRIAQAIDALATANLGKQTYTTGSGTFTIPTGTTASTVFKVTAIGGGGGGSFSSGGDGATAVQWFSGWTAGNTVSYSVGTGGNGSTAGGTGNTAGNSSTLSSGTQTISTLTAGGGGAGAQSNGATSGGAGGTASGGTLNLTGRTGGVQGCLNGATACSAPANSGQGGQGAFNPGTQAAGAGGSGLIIIEWVL